MLWERTKVQRCKQTKFELQPLLTQNPILAVRHSVYAFFSTKSVNSILAPSTKEILDSMSKPTE